MNNSTIFIVSFFAILICFMMISSLLAKRKYEKRKWDYKQKLKMLSPEDLLIEHIKRRDSISVIKFKETVVTHLKERSWVLRRCTNYSFDEFVRLELCEDETKVLVTQSEIMANNYETVRVYNVFFEIGEEGTNNVVKRIEQFELVKDNESNGWLVKSSKILPE